MYLQGEAQSEPGEHFPNLGARSGFKVCARDSRLPIPARTSTRSATLSRLLFKMMDTNMRLQHRENNLFCVTTP
jgi:hypothetical protein